VNLRRGFLRLWAVLAVTWLSAVAIYTVNFYRPPTAPAPHRPECLEAKPPPSCQPWETDPLVRKELDEFSKPVPAQPARVSPRNSLWIALLLAILPPAVLLLLGTSLVWVANGFKRAS